MAVIDAAQAAYDWVMSYEMQRRGIDPADTRTASFVRNHLMSKSALYQRLKEGLPPLVLPPPTAYGYPWYSAIEEASTHEVDAHFTMSHQSDPTKPIDAVIIQQSLWNVVERTSDTDCTVTYRGWAELGYRWRLWQVMVPASETTAFILAHHDHQLSRVTTLSELEALGRYWAETWRDKLIRVAGGGAATECLGSVALYPGLSRMLNEQESERTQRELAARRAEGLPDLPTAEEVKHRAKEEVEKYLERDWLVGDGGLLYRKQWLLQRLAPMTLLADTWLTMPPGNRNGQRP